MIELCLAYPRLPRKVPDGPSFLCLKIKERKEGRKKGKEERGGEGRGREGKRNLPLTLQAVLLKNVF